MNPYKVEWLNKIETQRVNKFYRRFHFRAKLKSDDACVVVKNQQKEIVASGFLRDYSEFKLLTGVAVASHLQKRGIATLLLKELSISFGQDTYTFPYQHLIELYQRHGFLLTEPTHVNNAVKNLYLRYLNQGRKIRIMAYRNIPVNT